MKSSYRTLKIIRKQRTNKNTKVENKEILQMFNVKT